MINDNRDDFAPPVVMPPVRRDPSISITGERPGGDLRADEWTPRRSARAQLAYDRGRRVGTVIGSSLAAAVLVLLASVVVHAVWLAIEFGLWR